LDKVGNSTFFFPGKESDRLALGSCLPDSDSRFGLGRTSCGKQYKQMGRSVRTQDSVLVGFAGCCPQRASIADRQFGHFDGCRNLQLWQIQARAEMFQRHTLTQTEMLQKAVRHIRRDPVKRVLFGALAGVAGCWGVLLGVCACAYYTKGDDTVGETEPPSSTSKANMSRVPTEIPPQELGHSSEFVPQAGPETFVIGEDEDEDIELKADAFDFGDDGDHRGSTSHSRHDAKNLDNVALE